ncbi:MAG TPA: 3-isopropylmalate dehydrogenase [Candidatus Didemnitutus sp.]|nr:3-isopropylmalate dehydrogenase [Candidatus Didemnitutus sp.]
MNAKIVLLSGDGIGPEVVGEARRVLDAVAERFGHKFSFTEHLLGGCAIDATGTAMPDATLTACKASDAVLLGAVGGPKWDDPQSPVRPEQGLLAIRKGLGLYANLRPVKAIPSLAKLSPLKPEKVAGVDFLVIRELTGGLYFGQPKGRTQTPEGERAVDTLIYTEGEIRRIVKLAFQLARGRRKAVTSIDKANVLESSRLWRKIAIEVGKEFPDVKLDHQLVDSAAMRLITHAAQFDVIVTENMFGDILTDEAAVLVGSLGLLPSASLGEGKIGLYEPIHGSAPDIAGKGIANPTGTILSAAMLLRHSLGLEKEARAVETAVAAAIDDGQLTADLGATKALNTSQMGAAIRERLDRAPVAVG